METDDKPWLFKPGQSGNPNGRPAISAEEREMTKNFKEAFITLGNVTIEEIQRLARDPTQKLPVVLAAKAVDWAFRKGNPSMFREIWDRTMGKVTQQIEHSGEIANPYMNKTAEELEALVKQRLEKKHE